MDSSNQTSEDLTGNLELIANSLKGGPKCSKTNVSEWITWCFFRNAGHVAASCASLSHQTGRSPKAAHLLALLDVIVLAHSIERRVIFARSCKYNSRFYCCD